MHIKKFSSVGAVQRTNYGLQGGSKRSLGVISIFIYSTLLWMGLNGQDGKERHEDYRTCRIFKIPDDSNNF